MRRNATFNGLHSSASARQKDFFDTLESGGAIRRFLDCQRISRQIDSEGKIFKRKPSGFSFGLTNASECNIQRVAFQRFSAAKRLF